MSKCNQFYPTADQVNCNKSEGNHEEHSGYSYLGDHYLDWPNQDYIPPTRKTGRKGKVSNKNKGILKQMATRVSNEKIIRHYIPTEADDRGRVALYLLKYLGEWIDLEELQIKEVAGGAALAKLTELMHFGWPIEIDATQHGPLRYRLTEDPRRPLWTAAPGVTTIVPS